MTQTLTQDQVSALINKTSNELTTEQAKFHASPTGLNWKTLLFAMESYQDAKLNWKCEYDFGEDGKKLVRSNRFINPSQM